jgi:hypothetical protein
VSTIWVKELVGGLDTRRMPETTSGGALIKAQDGHITRGGEFEKRPAFVKAYTLPTGATKGLAAGKNGLVVFGNGSPPTLPAAVSYQRIEHLDGLTALNKVLSYDLYGGKLYTVGEYADGSRYHFYDGVRIADWYDGRARASFRVTAGTGVSQLTSITVNGVTITTGAVTWATSNENTAALIAADINTASSSPDYTATAVGDQVNIIAADAGTAANGRVVVTNTSGGFGVTPSSGVALSGGSNPSPAVSATGSFTITGGTSGASNKINDVTVNGVSIISAPVSWATSHANTASDVASAINSYSSSPDYTASAVGAVVTITASTAGSAINGATVAVTVGGTVTVGSIQAMSGGADSQSIFVPGTFVKTIGSRVHSVSGSLEHFSGISAPTKWTTDTTGAGFIDMSTQSSGSEVLTSLARYQNYVAVFAERAIQIWYYDSDPSLNAQKQVLNNTGTSCPRSVTQFGDNDLFYADTSGLRSLRARDASNAAATTDIGVPVDSLIAAKLRQLSSDQRQKVIGLIEPSEGRFWLAALDTIYVFSFFSGSKISAWTTYTPSTNDGETLTSFAIDDVAVYQRKVYIRSGDDIYVFGGLDATPAYDSTEAEAWLPYLDGNAPAKEKALNGIDAAVRGEWEVSVAMDPDNQDAQDSICTIKRSTFNEGMIDGEGKFNHISVRFKSKGDGQAKLGAVAIHFDGDAVADK